VCIIVEAKMVHRVLPDGRMVKEEPPPSWSVLDLPVSSYDVASDVLQSGVAILPGETLPCTPVYLYV